MDGYGLNEVNKICWNISRKKSNIKVVLMQNQGIICIFIFYIMMSTSNAVCKSIQHLIGEVVGFAFNSHLIGMGVNILESQSYKMIIF